MSIEKSIRRQEISLQLLQRYASGERNFSGTDFKSVYLNNECLIDINLRSANLNEIASVKINSA